MAAQEVKQIYQLVNEAAQQSMGETSIAAIDGTSLVTLGETILSSETLGNDFVPNVMNKIGRTQVAVRKYDRSLEQALTVSDMEYGNILEKINFRLGDVEEDQSYLTDGASVDMYKVHKPEVVVKYFTKQTPYQNTITTQRVQLKKAFTSAQSMGAFLDGQMLNAKNKMALAGENLALATLGNFISAIGANRRIDLRPIFTALFPDHSTTPTAQLFVNGDFLRFVAAYIQDLQLYFTKFNLGVYNDGTVERHTPYDRQRLCVLGEFVHRAEKWSYSSAFHDDFVRLPGYAEIPYWQSIKEPGSTYITTTAGSAKYTNVIALLSDRDALGICRHDYRVSTSPYNVSGEYWNTVEKQEDCYYNDISENGAVLYVSDPA